MKIKILKTINLTVYTTKLQNYPVNRYFCFTGCWLPKLSRSVTKYGV